MKLITSLFIIYKSEFGFMCKELNLNFWESFTLAIEIILFWGYFFLLNLSE